jgi:CBS domain-containing protein
MNEVREHQARMTSIGDAPISDYMTPSPACIAAHRTLADAWQAMQHEHVRHLPVLDGGAVVGMISQRDLGLLGAGSATRLEDVRVADAMSGDPYVVAPRVSLRVVIDQLNAQKIGSAIVVDKGRVLGVFTTTDALALLRRMLDATSST